MTEPHPGKVNVWRTNGDRWQCDFVCRQPGCPSQITVRADTEHEAVDVLAPRVEAHFRGLHPEVAAAWGWQRQ